MKKFNITGRLKVVSIIIVSVISMLTLQASFVHALETYMVDEFDTNNPLANTHWYTTGHGDELDCTEMLDPENPLTRVLHITWDSSLAGQWWFSNTLDHYIPSTVLDATLYSHLTFDIKGAAGGENFKIEIQEYPSGDLVEYDILNFIDSITTEWQEVKIPLFSTSPLINCSFFIFSTST